MHVSRISQLLLLIQSTVRSQGPEQRASDGWKGSEGLLPSMQYDCHRVSCACSSPRNAPPFPLNPPFPFPLPFLLLTRRPLSGLGLPCILIVVPRPETRFFVIKRSLARKVTSSVTHCPLSSSEQSSTMKVLFMLLPCPLTAIEGFSIDLFGVQNDFTNTVLTSSKSISRDIHSLERKGTCESLSGLHSDHLQQ